MGVLRPGQRKQATVGTEGPASVSCEFGRLLRHHRLAKGLSQEALAERARMSAHGISALERGHRRRPQFETLTLLAGALALSEHDRREFVVAAGAELARQAGSVTVGPWSDTASSSFPAALTSFVGRKAELEEIRTLMREQRMVTLTGAGGIGKTRTATQIARKLGDAGDGAVCFVGFAPIRDPSLVAPTIASALGVQKVPKRPLLETLCAYLKNKSLLLILDNCEHVIEEAAIVAEALLNGCPRVQILATSRERLRAAGEHAYRLPPLIANDAVGLFADRACAVDHRFFVTTENASEIEQICRSVDGMPLAIELAAARVNVLSVKALAAKLDDRLGTLSGGDRIADPRMQAMRGTLDWSYSLLSEPEQRVFERLSIFAGGCTLNGATNVCASKGTVLDLLASLVDKSLVVAELEGPEPRYRLLESFRQYAHERLVARGEDQVVARRHAATCLDLVEWANGVQECEPQYIWAGLCVGEQHNLRAALEWSLRERHDVPLGQRLASRAAIWVSIIHEDGRSWITAALNLADQETPREVLAALYYAQSCLATEHFEYNAVLAIGKGALALYREVGDPLGVVRTQCHLGEALFCLGRREEAQEVLVDALRLARTLGTRCRCSLATVLQLLAVSTDDVVAGRGYISEQLQIYKALGLTRGVPHALMALAICEFRAANLEQALKYATDAVAIAPPGSYTRISPLGWLSRFLVESTRYDEAKETSRELLVLAREYHLDVQAAWTLDLVACVATLRAQEAADRAPSAYANAGRVLGFVNARIESLEAVRDFIEQPQYDRVLAVLRETLGADALARLMAEGAAATEEQAVDVALAL
jgi:predicted ATPase/DNA-binding XRE family transcriptional regulator